MSTVRVAPIWAEGRMNLRLYPVVCIAVAGILGATNDVEAGRKRRSADPACQPNPCTTSNCLAPVACTATAAPNCTPCTPTAPCCVPTAGCCVPSSCCATTCCEPVCCGTTTCCSANCCTSTSTQAATVGQLQDELMRLKADHERLNREVEALKAKLNPPTPVEK